MNSLIPLNLRLLGHPLVSLANQPVTGFVSRRSLALLLYLATTGETLSRSKAATLFWPDADEPRALKNLRDLLDNLRRLVGAHLIITRQAISFDKDAPHSVDVVAFRRLRQLLIGPLQVDAITQLVDLWQGEFLDGFYLDGAPEFEQWQLLERESLRDLALRALDLLADYHITQRQTELGLGIAERLLTLDAWRESAHRQRMKLLVLAGQRHAAISQYEQCRRLLDRELGATPSTPTQILYKRILEGAPPEAIAEPERPVHVAQPRALTSPHNLPRSLTPFFGREEELVLLTELLCRSGLPLITLSGLGGAGKTRLALEAARRSLARYPDGVWLVPYLSLLTRPQSEGRSWEEQLALGVMAATGLKLAPNQPVMAQITNALRGRKMLIVLDDYEGVPGAREILLEFLRADTDCTVLVTSHTPLGLQAETVVRVGGLPVPPMPGSENGDIEQLPNRYPSLGLFVDRARRLRPTFRLTPELLPEVIAICRMVDGLPLGIELVASVAMRRSPAAAAARLKADLNELITIAADVPARHRSLQAVLEDNWRLLGPDEADALAAWSIFEGPVSAEAAEAALGITPDVIDRLMMKSMVDEAPPDRYRLAHLVRRYAAQQLAQAPERNEQVRRQHAHYFLTSLLDRAGRLGAERQALAEVQADLDDIRAAWVWAAETQNFGLLGRAVGVFALALSLLGLYQEAVNLLGLAIDAERSAVASGFERAEHEQALARILLEISTFSERLGNYDLLLAQATEALDIGLMLGDVELQAAAYQRVSSAHYARHDDAALTVSLERGLALSRAAGLKRFEAIGLSGLALLRVRQQRLEDAIPLYEAALTLARKLSLMQIAGMIMGDLVHARLCAGDLLDARALSEEHVALRTELGDRSGIGVAHRRVGECLHALGELDEALTHLAQAHDIFASLGEQRQQAEVLICLAVLYEHRGDLQQAEACATTAGALQGTLAVKALEGEALAWLAHFQARRGRCVEAESSARRAICALADQGAPEHIVLAHVSLAEALAENGRMHAAVAELEPVLDQLTRLECCCGNFAETIFLALYNVLATAGDPRSDEVLGRGQALLSARSQALPDTEARARYLNALPARRELVRLMQSSPIPA